MMMYDTTVKVIAVLDTCPQVTNVIRAVRAYVSRHHAQYQVWATLPDGRKIEVTSVEFARGLIAMLGPKE